MTMKMYWSLESQAARGTSPSGTSPPSTETWFSGVVTSGFDSSLAWPDFTIMATLFHATCRPVHLNQCCSCFCPYSCTLWEQSFCTSCLSSRWWNRLQVYKKQSVRKGIVLKMKFVYKISENRGAGILSDKALGTLKRRWRPSFILMQSCAVLAFIVPFPQQHMWRKVLNEANTETSGCGSSWKHYILLE